MGDTNKIDAEFNAAVQLITKGPPPGTKAPKIELSNEQKLEFYALFKQATEGPNNTKPPGRLDLINRAKWTAWKNVGKLSKAEAKKKVTLRDKPTASCWCSLCVCSSSM